MIAAFPSDFSEDQGPFADSAETTTADGVVRQMVEQGTLADPGLTAQHEGSAGPGAHGGEQVVQRGALAAPAEQAMA